MLVQNPPMRMLTTEELDRVYDLPYMRTWHPSYQDEGGVPGLQEVEFSIAHNRGCFGACKLLLDCVPSGAPDCGAECGISVEGSQIADNTARI